MSTSVKSRLRVALLIETSNRYGRDLLHGVHDWVSAGERWSIRSVEQQRHSPPPAWLREWQGDGIIARVDSDEIATALKRTGLPVVDVSAERPASEFPHVGINNRAVAQMAATHLLSKKLSNYAFCGDDRFLWSRKRGETFMQVMRAGRKSCHEFRQGNRRPAAGSAGEMDLLVNWLKQLPKPVGVFACYDERAQKILEACHQAGLTVPEEVAVLGVDDDELICELCDPPLSSVLLNARRTGYEAAAILSNLMTKRAPVSLISREIEPVRVVERHSTDAIAVNDGHVAAALLYIREHSSDGIDVSDVLRAVPVSRTLLERKFVKLLGVSPHRLIKRHKIERVCQLLVESDLAIARVADMTGFESASYLSAAFLREKGETPRVYRARHRSTKTGKV